MWNLSGVIDEISPGPIIQIDTLERASMRSLDLRGVWSKNVLARSNEEIGIGKTALDRHGVL